MTDFLRFLTGDRKKEGSNRYNCGRLEILTPGSLKFKGKETRVEQDVFRKTYWQGK